MIFDTHAHYDDEAFNEDREELLGTVYQNGVDRIINVGASLKTTANTLELIKKYDFMYGAVGVHPDEAGELNEASYQWLRESARKEKIVAIGEIGLDYYWDNQPRELQKKWFVRQMELAVELGLPIIIHSREAAQDTLELVKSMWEKSPYLRGVMHCYSYSPEMAEQYLDMGFYLGIGGVITFKNARKLKETVAACPVERLLLETDCPYLSPEPYRGKRNSSLNLKYVVKATADIKGMSEKEIEAVTHRNAEELFRI